MMDNKLCSGAKCADWGLLLLRVVLGIVFIYHGYGKLFGQMPGMEAFTGMVDRMGFPLPALFAYLAALTECIGGIAMLAGAYTRYAGYLLAIVMLVAMGLAKKFAYPMIELDLTLFAMALAVAWIGPGSFVLMKNMVQGGCCCGKKDCAACSPGDKK